MMWRTKALIQEQVVRLGQSGRIARMDVHTRNEPKSSTWVAAEVPRPATTRGDNPRETSPR